MVEIYIKLAELETRREVSHENLQLYFFPPLDKKSCVVLFSIFVLPFCEETVTSFSFLFFSLTKLQKQDTNKRMTLPRELRSLRPLELVGASFSIS